MCSNTKRMKQLITGFGVAIAATLVFAAPARAQSYLCEEQIHLEDQDMACYRQGPELPRLPVPDPPKPDPLRLRVLSYAKFAVNHRLTGLASYYSTSLNGTLTANGERYYNKKLSAAHLTLPLGCWVEVKSRATGRKIRLRVNDRGPYVHKFVIDLSQAAARALGVDVAEDRKVEIRVIAMPGETPLPEDVLDGPAATVAEEAPAAAPATSVAQQR
jgi:peptidoglycan lytic transglycosylase